MSGGGPPEETELSVTLPGGAGRRFRCFARSAALMADVLAARTYPLIPDIGRVETIVDVGANVGAASLLFRYTWPEARLVAFEPAKAPFRLLAHNLLGLPRVSLRPYGLFDRTMTASLHVGLDPVASSVYAGPETGAAVEAIELVEARQALADEAVERVDVLKLDAEGAELPILGALAPLLPAVRVLYLEYHSEADRRAIDGLVAATHLLAASRAEHPHRGDLCYVARDTPYAARWQAMALTHG